MKKVKYLLIITLTIVMMVSITGCGKKKESKEEQTKLSENSIEKIVQYINNDIKNYGKMHLELYSGYEKNEENLITDAYFDQTAGDYYIKNISGNNQKYGSDEKQYYYEDGWQEQDFVSPYNSITNFINVIDKDYDISLDDDTKIDGVDCYQLHVKYEETNDGISSSLELTYVVSKKDYNLICVKDLDGITSLFVTRDVEMPRPF